MSAILIGGMDRLHREYIETAQSLNVNLKVFAGQERSIKKQLGGADFLILCTGKVSHAARREVARHAAVKNIPLFMIHSSGVSSLRCCLEGIAAPEVCASCPNQSGSPSCKCNSVQHQNR